MACASMGRVGFVVDEVDPSLDEMLVLATAYQHFVTEGRQVALIMAGLPHQVDRLVSSKSVSFLRRARRHEIGRISDLDVMAALEATVGEAGGSISGPALSAAAEAIGGFAYMLQLVGYEAWAASSGGRITEGAVREGIVAAHDQMKEQVFAPTLLELSETNLAFLCAMLPDSGASRIADVAARMGKSPGYTATYRTRLAQ